MMTSERREAEEAEGGEAAGYRTKNKNPTQRCGELAESCENNTASRYNNIGQAEYLPACIE